MQEIQKKYQIGVRRFGLVNWTGAYNLYVKEVNRFFIVWAQTLLSPLISSLLFLSVLSLAIGNDRGNVLGFPFISFLVNTLTEGYVSRELGMWVISTIVLFYVTRGGFHEGEDFEGEISTVVEELLVEAEE